MYNISIFKFWFKYIFLKTPIEIESIEIIERFYNATIREKKLINRVKKMENTSDNTQAQALNKTDVSTRCDGSRYNFKKGMEFCPNKENCKLYEYHKSDIDWIKYILWTVVCVSFGMMIGMLITI